MYKALNRNNKGLVCVEHLGEFKRVPIRVWSNSWYAALYWILDL